MDNIKIDKVERVLGIYTKLMNGYPVNKVREAQNLYHEIEETFSSKNSSAVQAEHSVALAKACGVDNPKIMKSNKDLDDFFG